MLPSAPDFPSLDRQAPWRPHATKVRSITREVPGVATYELELEDAALRQQFRFLPGQFNMLYLPGIGECAISISSSADDAQQLLHTIRVVGNVTRAIARLQPGDPILIRGPFGSAWPMDLCRGCDVVIAAGGLGLAPLRPAIYHILRRRSDYGRVVLLYGARSPGDLLFTAEYDAWRAAGMELQITVDLGDENWQGQIGVVPALLSRLRLREARTRVLTCGPEIMMRFVVFETIARRIPRESIYLSMERNMNCALGHCGHCQLGPAFVCKDGPVFSYPQLEPYLHIEDF